jgi:predicted PurR-regulated permease PerM
MLTREVRRPSASASDQSVSLEGAQTAAVAQTDSNFVEEKNKPAEPSPASQATDAPLARPHWTVRRHNQHQSVALTIIATLAIIYTASAAQAILFPITLAILFALTLRPIVRFADRRGVSPLVTTLALMFFVVAAIAAGMMMMVEPAQTWIHEAPKRMEVVGQKLSSFRDGINELYSVSERLENLASGGSLKAEDDETEDPQALSAIVGKNAGEQEPATAEKSPEPIPVELKQPRLLANLSVLNSAGNMAGMIGIALIVGFFLLLEGDTLLNNILNITPRWTDKKNTVQLVYKLEDGVSKYLLTVSLINIALGVAVAIAMWLLGVPNAMLWGVLATLLNFIPFLGALLGVVIIFLVSVFSFDSLGYALVPPSVFLILTTIEGNFITPSLVGRSVSVNSVAVLLSLILWGWLWGIGGAFVGVPLLIIFKLICDQFERTAPIGALLSGR